ncbi:MAG: hypothetical protein JWM33_792, partial [Caulobacteraceae bacterium]|nr:hypothetical protein [Caulobacteraceae bacterium]
MLTRACGLVDGMSLDDNDEQPRRGRGGDRTLAVVISLAGHLALVAAILLSRAPHKIQEMGPISVELVDAPKPFPSAAALAAAA